MTLEGATVGATFLGARGVTLMTGSRIGVSSGGTLALACADDTAGARAFAELRETRVATDFFGAGGAGLVAGAFAGVCLPIEVTEVREAVLGMGAFAGALG